MKRARAGVGQVELARRIDVIEVYAFAKALGVDPRTLFGEIIDRLPEKADV